MGSHHDVVRDQFTRQAVPFSAAPAIRNEDALQRLLQFTDAGPRDTVLDVACGPGIVACAFAGVTAHATGIDLTAAMIARARELQAAKRLANVAWQVGDVVALPYADESFSIVTSRYAFHHLQDPQSALAEMKRVCRPGGRVALIDMVASDDPRRAAALNRMERLRDPSHVRSMTLAEMRALFASVGLRGPRMMTYRLDTGMEALMKGSFPNDGDALEVQRLIVDSLHDDGLGMSTRQDNGSIRISYPIAALVAVK